MFAGACLEAESCDEQDDDGVPGDEWEEDKDISVVNGTVAISDPSESEESSGALILTSTARLKHENASLQSYVISLEDNYNHFQG